MNIPIYGSSEWEKKLEELPRLGTINVTAFYEHRIGAICKNSKFLLIPVDDHLVHRGDGVFESISLSEGKILQLDAHMDRLKSSSEALYLTPPLSWEKMEEIFFAVAKVGNFPNGNLKILLGRGEGGMGVDPAESPKASFFCIASKGIPIDAAFFNKGLTACRSEVPAKEPYLAQIKSTNYLPNVFMTMEAKRKGVNLTFSFDNKGHLAEAAIANVGIINKSGELIIPPFHHTLPGTTVLLAMELASSFIDVKIDAITQKDILEAKEVLIFGTSPKCVAVTHYENVAIGSGKPGPISAKLRAALIESLQKTGKLFL